MSEVTNETMLIAIKKSKMVKVYVAMIDAYVKVSKVEWIKLNKESSNAKWDITFVGESLKVSESTLLIHELIS